MSWRTKWHHEFWPAWLLYAPIMPYIGWLMVRHGGVTVFTACNPGISHGGGFIGESKSEIMSALPQEPSVAKTVLIPVGEVEARLSALRVAIGGGLSFPLILKPDAGQRGHGVRLVRDEGAARVYFAEMTNAAVAQAYALGPCECGVLWIRHEPGDAQGQTRGETGFIYAVTRKEFPVVVGDGRRTLGQLVEGHARFALQARVFRARYAAAWGSVPAMGERVRLAEAGNHCQGTLFRDGADLVTPELSRAIDTLAANFAGGLDVGRFDIRYTSDGALRRGEGFTIVELNGTTSEPTNMYDPDRSVVWAWGVLARQWGRIFALGAWRRRAGRPTVSFGELWRAWRGHAAGVRGSAVSD